jgi:hypothetical protein
MKSWPDLPEAPLRRAGPCSASLLRAGCATYRDAARYLHELPYGRNSDRSDYRLVLVEGRGTCSTKHALLAAVAREQGLPVSLRVGIYDMSEANTPGVGRVLTAHGLDSIPEAHCYLAYGGERVDITRSGVAPQSEIPRLHREWTIEPSQIGEHKIELHRRYLEAWLGHPLRLGLSLAEIWRIRESCIAALSSA